MNGKKLAALAFVVSLAASTLPTYAAAVTKTVTVQWNTQAIASLTLTTQASAATTHAAGGEIIYQGFSAGGTTAGCNGSTTGLAGVAGAANDTSANGTVNFGNVTPDGAANTFCLEVNAVAANVSTNDTNGYTVAEEYTAGTPAGYGTNQNTCLYADGAYANNLAYTASARAAAITTSTATTCPTGFTMPVSPAVPTTILTTAAATAATVLNADMGLFVAANAPTNAVTATLTYTLTPL